MDELISSPYPITPIGYFKRYIRNIDRHNDEQDKSYLLYAALELRFTIESLLFHYLHALNDGDLSKSQKQLYRPQDLRKAILEADPLFLVKLEFADMCSFFNNMISAKLRPDVNLLSSVHGRLGDWLHAEYTPICRKIPEESWIELGDLFDSINGHLSLILSYPLLNVNLTDEGENLVREYAAGKISKEEAVEQMNRRWNQIFRGVTHHILLDE
jgi:hypothetical protein